MTWWRWVLFGITLHCFACGAAFAGGYVLEISLPLSLACGSLAIIGEIGFVFAIFRSIKSE